MDVILRSDVDHVGLRGDVVAVARGFARNYLLPRGLAEVATPAKVAELQKRDANRARHEAKSVDEARKLVEQIGKTELRFDVKSGPTGSLFGSITATNIADELWERAKVRVDRRKIDLHDPIKRIGRYTVPIEIFTDVTAEVRTLVVPEGGELPPEEELEAMVAAEQAEAAKEAGAAHADPAAVVEYLDDDEPAGAEESAQAAADAEPGLAAAPEAAPEE
jgi:large subunit ribosomal protein L9